MSKTEKVTLLASVQSSAGVQARGIRAEPGEGQRITIRRQGWSETTVSTEMDTARRYAVSAGAPFTRFTKAPEDDDVDVIAKSSDDTIVQEFQVTRPWGRDFLEASQH